MLDGFHCNTHTQFATYYIISIFILIYFTYDEQYLSCLFFLVVEILRPTNSNTNNSTWQEEREKWRYVHELRVNWNTNTNAFLLADAMLNQNMQRRKYEFKSSMSFQLNSNRINKTATTSQ